MSPRSLTAPVRILIGALLFAVCTLGRSEETTISVQAPFPMPPIPVATFPDRDFAITDFDAKEIPADSTSPALATDAFRGAIQACHDSGGGRVVVPR